MNLKRDWLFLIAGFAGAMLGTFGVIMFNSHVLFTLPGFCFTERLNRESLTEDYHSNSISNISLSKS